MTGTKLNAARLLPPHRRYSPAEAHKEWLCFFCSRFRSESATSGRPVPPTLTSSTSVSIGVCNMGAAISHNKCQRRWRGQAAAIAARSTSSLPRMLSSVNRTRLVSPGTVILPTAWASSTTE